MTISRKDLIYWYRQLCHQLSGWTPQEQIQFHRYAIQQLEGSFKKGGAQ